MRYPFVNEYNFIKMMCSFSNGYLEDSIPHSSPKPLLRSERPMARPAHNHQRITKTLSSDLIHSPRTGTANIMVNITGKEQSTQRRQRLFQTRFRLGSGSSHSHNLKLLEEVHSVIVLRAGQPSDEHPSGIYIYICNIYIYIYTYTYVTYLYTLYT